MPDTLASPKASMADITPTRKLATIVALDVPGDDARLTEEAN